MNAAVKSIPDGYHSVTPYLYVRDAAALIDFYKQAFGAAEILRMNGPDGRIGHAELQIGSSRIMLADESPAMKAYSPLHYGGASSSFMLYVENVDDVVAQAVAAGAKITRPIADQFYGDRTGGIEDPSGQNWYVATHIKDVSPEELEQGAKAAAAAAAKSKG
jgi:PhnB protein